MTTSAESLVECCVAAGVTTAFTVPGESFLGVLDALYEHPDIRTVAARHEGGASFMAEAAGKLRRRPSLAMATRAVGASNLAIGVHTALQDSAPMVVLLGQVSRRWRHRESFQEADLTAMFRPLAKWAVEVTDPARLPELTSKALSIATSGRPGPVVISVPEDVFTQDIAGPERDGPFAPWRPRGLPDGSAVATWADGPRAETLDAILARIRSAVRPALLLGGGALLPGAGACAVRLAEHEELPVVAAWRRPDVFPNDHRLYLGQTGYSAPPSVARRLAAADFVLVVGCRLSEVASFGYTIPAADWAHVDIDPDVLARSTSASVTVLADAAVFLRDLAARAAQDPARPAAGRADANRADRAAANRADRAVWERETTPVPAAVSPGGRYVDATAVAGLLRQLVPADAIMTTDAGNFAGWIARYLRWNRPFSFLGPTSGAMGYAVPAAIGAKLTEPGRPVVAFAGDGGFMMTGAEIETAVREHTPIVTVVFDNGQYGTIRMHAERRYPGRPVATRLGSVDFAAFTRSMGGDGVTIDRIDDFADALKVALASPRPFTIAVPTDPGIISVDAAAAIR